MNSDLEIRLSELLRKPFKNKEEELELESLFQSLREQLRKEQGNLLNEIKERGLIIDNVWDLVKTRESYPEAIDVLINHLNKDYHEKNIEGIVRALCVKEAKGKATKPLIDLFEKTTNDRIYLKRAIVNTLRIVITNDQFGLIIPIILNKENRIFADEFIKMLGKSKKSIKVLTELSLLNENEIAHVAFNALLKFKSKEARDAIALLVKNLSNEQMRNEAHEALSKLK